MRSSTGDGRAVWGAGRGAPATGGSPSARHGAWSTAVNWTVGVVGRAPRAAVAGAVVDVHAPPRTAPVSADCPGAVDVPVVADSPPFGACRSGGRRVATGARFVFRLVFVNLVVAVGVRTWFPPWQLQSNHEPCGSTRVDPDGIAGDNDGVDTDSCGALSTAR